MNDIIIKRELPPEIPEKTWVSVDLEIFGAEEWKLHRPITGKFACMTACINPGEVYLITDPEQVRPALFNIANGILTFHHAKFDITHLNRWGYIGDNYKVWDTMLMERVLWGGYYDLFGLEHLARRYLDTYIDKSQQKKFIEATELSEESIQYAVTDSHTTRLILDEQRKHVTKTDLEIFKLDMEAMWAIMNFMGFRIDVDSWKALAERNKERAQAIEDTLPVNPRSPKQVLNLLRKEGFKGLPSTGEEVLSQYIRKYPDTTAAELANAILENRKYSTRVSRYGMNIIDKYVEQDLMFQVPVIIADYHPTGADTGRTACSDPNMQNIIARDTKEFRECFIARPDHSLIIADYSQQEVGIAAHISQDEKLISAFNSGKDVYIQMAKMIYGRDIDKSDPLRADMKSIVLGGNYGLTPAGLAARQNITLQEAEKIFKLGDAQFPQLARWKERQKKSKNYTKTILGRKAWLNPYDSQSPNNALNNPIQGSAGDMIKLALAKMYRDWSFDFPYAVVGEIHDEIILDVPNVALEETTEFVQESMVSVANNMCPGLKFKVGIVVGQNWAAK